MSAYISRPASRRSFLKRMAAGAGALATAGSGFRVWGSGLAPYEGRLLVTWPFGISSTDMAADVEQLAAEGAA